MPEDVSVAGFDGVLPSHVREKAVITSAAVPLEALGSAAVRLLAWRLQTPDAPRRTIMLATTLIPGETVAPPREAL